MLLPTVPAVVFFKEEDVLASATRADNTIRPPTRYKVLTAVGRIREVDDGFLKRGRFHTSRITRIVCFVKYIIALWSIVRSLSKGLQQIRAWIDCWASFRSFDPNRRETEPAIWQSIEVSSSGGSRAIEVFSERPVDLRTSYCQWLASVSEKGSEPSAAELEEATGKMKGQVPLHFSLELYERRFESVRPSAAALLHCVKADSGPSVAVLDRIYQRHEMDVPRQTENRQSVLLIHSHIR